MEKLKGKAVGEAMQSHSRNAKSFMPIRAKEEAENDSGQSILFITQKFITITHSHNVVCLVSGHSNAL